MKRYWKFVLLVSVIVLTFSTFYIQSSFATKGLPRFKIEHQNGDPAELEKMLIRGYYYDDHIGANLQINQDGTFYENRQSYVSMLKAENYFSGNIIRLQKEYRNFMRDKQEGNEEFFENDEILAYANINMDFKHFGGQSHYDFTFEIETLHKQTKKKNKFTTRVPKAEDYDYLFVDHIQLTDSGDLKVFTRNSLMPNIDAYDELYHYISRDEMHVYTFDLTKQSLVSNETIQQPDIGLKDNVSFETSTLYDGNYIGPTEYIIYFNALREVEPRDDGYVDEELLESYLMSYHVETGEQRKLDLPKEIDEEYDPTLYVDPIIYFEKYDSNQYELIKYNIVDEEIELKQTFDLKESSEEVFPNDQIIDDKVYIVSPFKSNDIKAHVQIGDINTGEMLYEGTIEVDSNDPDTDYTLDLYYIEELGDK